MEVDPRADAVLTAARGTGRLLLTEHASTTDLAPLADTLLPAGDLATQVHQVQHDGGVVLIVADDDADALHRADVGVGVARPGRRPPWAADLLCGSDLLDVWRVLQLPPVARRNSGRDATLAFSGSALSELVTLVAARPSGLSRTLGGGPVSMAALAAMAVGAAAAARADRRPTPPAVVRADWHALTAQAVERRVGAHKRDPATLPEGTAGTETGIETGTGPAGGLRRLAAAVADDLRDPLVPVLLLGATASAVLGSTVDAALVAGVSLANALVSGAQKARAESALRRLVTHHIPLARIVTTLGVQVVPAVVLQPGDLIEVRSADVVPADARLVAADAVEADEAALTGESLPIEKITRPTPAAELADRRCMLYQGTTVVAGSGRAVVVATGGSTQAGRAAAAAADRPVAVGMAARLSELTSLAMPLIGLAGFAVTSVALLRGASMRGAVNAGIAIAVAAVPEGLPLVATVAQVAVARRLARQRVLVRSPRTVEALGRLDWVCFDKTGTLTEGRLVLRQVMVCAAGDRWQRLPARSPEAAAVVRTAVTASPVPGGVVAHATDQAVLDAYAQVGVLSGRRVADLPFETSRGYSAAVVRTEGGFVLAVKGAPEVLLGRCRLDDPGTRAAHRAATDIAQRGLRVLAVARRSVPCDRVEDGSDPKACIHSPDSPDDLHDLHDLELLGFVGLADTPRPSAGRAVHRLAEDGLRVTMVTGDHPVTAAAIAAEVGIPRPKEVITGRELDRLSDDEHARRVADASVFARISPEQKVRLVRALQRSGHVVAMTGDGINDAAAIRTADVGIAVSGRRTAAARSAADILLEDVDVERLADAVVEGRRMWEAVTDAVSVLLGGNAGEIAFTLLGTALGRTAPLSPRQLLLVNLLTDMAPAMALAVRSRRAEPSPARPAAVAGRAGGRGWSEGPLRRMLLVRGAVTATAATAAWSVGRVTGTPRRASTIGLLTLVGTQLGQTLTLAPRDPLVVATAVGSAAALAVMIQTPGVSRLFGSTPLGPAGWTIVATSTTAATLAAWVYERRTGRVTRQASASASASASAVETTGEPVRPPA